jgi:hypothetical protein
MPDGSLVEVDLESNGTSRQSADGALWGDRAYDGMRTTDGVDISSRTKHREYMKRHGLTTFDDYKGEFARQQARRDEYHAGKSGTVNRADIARAIEKLMR